MAEVEQLLREFVNAFQTDGEANPRDYIDQLEGIDRSELEALIEAYLEGAPTRDWDSQAYRESNLERLSDQLHASVAGNSGFWPSLLPRLRNRSKLRRTQVVEKLATDLGHPEAAEKVGAYYHQMESGLLPSQGVSDRVLDALAGIVGGSVEGLRAAGQMLGAGTSEPGAVFARAPQPIDGELELDLPTEKSKWDEVDKLFQGNE